MREELGGVFPGLAEHFGIVAAKTKEAQGLDGGSRLGRQDCLTDAESRDEPHLRDAFERSSPRIPRETSMFQAG
jgi:hypothetical protein